MELRTGEPYWAIRNGLLQSYPPVRSDQSAEVVVLGAGITGALVARALALEGADVLVVDRHDVGMGSSAASTGLLQYATDRSLTSLIPKGWPGCQGCQGEAMRTHREVCPVTRSRSADKCRSAH